MIDYLYYTLDFLPWLTGLSLLLVFLFLTLRDYGLEQLRALEQDEESEFLRPNPRGYLYHVVSGVSVQIVSAGLRRYKIYVLTGSMPRGVAEQKDRYGRYFWVTASSCGEAEGLVDVLFL